MLKLEVEHPKPPIYGFPLQRSGDPAVVPFSVTVSSTEPVRIGAIRAAWQVTVQLPIAGRSVQECWTWGEVTPSETILTEVCANIDEVKPGHPERTDFTLYLPFNLPPSTDNDFEKIVHTLYVSAYPPAPEYQDAQGYATAAAESSKSAKWKSLGGMLGGKKKEASASGSAKGQSKFKSKSAGDPLAEAFGPAIASFSKEIKYVTPLQDRGVSRLDEISKVASVDDLGIVRTTVISNVMCVGSAFVICLRVDAIDPDTTISTAQLRLQQQSASHDGTETHFDDYTLHKWFEPPDEDGNPRNLFPGPSVHQPKSSAFPPRTGADFLHLTALPRLPSAACGGHVTTIANTKYSTVKHTLIIEMKFYTPTDFAAAGGSIDAGGRLPEHKQRTMVLKFDLTLGDCTMSYHSVQVPRYTVLAPVKLEAVQACLDPYPEGEEPLPCRFSRVSWIVRDGKALERRRVGYSASKIREHQLDTSSVCMCFFEDTTPPNPDGASWTDHIEPYTGPFDDETMEAMNRQIDKECLERLNRKHVPGFIHATFDECLCQEVRTTAGEARRGTKGIATYASEATST